MYSFLAGVAVTRGRLWLMPLASASFAVTALLVAALSRLLLPTYRWASFISSQYLHMDIFSGALLQTTVDRR